MRPDTGTPIGRLYDVQGRQLMLHARGDGGPAVVFLPGAGLVGLDFLTVGERVAALTASVVYDRAGTGWSRPAALPRTAADVADELADLLAVAGVPGPYVLAGHSLGAFYARRFAQRRPADVAGLLLIDPGHEDIMSYLPHEAAQMNERLTPDPDALPDLTTEQLQAAREQYAHILATWRVSLRETANFDTVIYDELRHGGPLPDVPLIVLTAGANPAWAQVASPELVRRSLDGVRAMHAALARSVPRGEQRVLDGASHQFAHIERGEAVVAAIADLLERARA
ncbi:alpha/beta hydrolase [Nonomuraea sp. NPDC046802]|uniref:alpha/beta fold hydrolase n=1 Tax=Nonomuraea sp. NPDC046802 TaxID=3154919 RepID=UPI0033D89251